LAANADSEGAVSAEVVMQATRVLPHPMKPIIVTKKSKFQLNVYHLRDNEIERQHHLVVGISSEKPHGKA
jgi:hypothetical protein